VRATARACRCPALSVHGRWSGDLTMVGCPTCAGAQLGATRHPRRRCYFVWPSRRCEPHETDWLRVIAVLGRNPASSPPLASLHGRSCGRSVSGNARGLAMRAVGLIGRRTETRALDDLVAAVRSCQSETLVLRGEPGVGKMALLVRRRPRGRLPDTARSRRSGRDGAGLRRTAPRSRTCRRARRVAAGAQLHGNRWPGVAGSFDQRTRCGNGAF